MKRVPIPIASMPSSNNPENNQMMPDLLWISKQQQQHPSTHAHPLKNTIRVNSSGIRQKFDGKQWRTLCQTTDGYDCRNLAFRSLLCQKHFYKVHLSKRPYAKAGSLPIPVLSEASLFALKRPLSHPYKPHHHYHHHHQQIEHHDSMNKNDSTIEQDDNNSIELLDNNDFEIVKQNTNKVFKNDSEPEFTFFSIDCDSPSEVHTNELEQIKVHSSPKLKRIDSLNNDSVTSNESENPSLHISIPKITESTRFGLPTLTRTEEKSLSNELIRQLPPDTSLSIAEQIARRRACEIVMDNYSHQMLPMNIVPEWFYDFLLRNPRLPIHFRSWFSSVNPTIPISDQIIDIKVWELGLVTRSAIPSSSNSTSSSSP
ncbi:unnamed protein product [Adineta steineri]|uniref:Uncharacterized protein n=1 Tax=Adineta steineri TaxID=433720 RepID=A0A819CDV4_9BILA|nr:unnamed protein product [Adineta steineri]CAF3806040.1 unnamed protein product [Adineta steineri]